MSDIDVVDHEMCECGERSPHGPKEMFVVGHGRLPVYCCHKCGRVWALALTVQRLPVEIAPVQP